MIKVKKTLNNSMLLVDNNNSEMILFGKGIGFNTRAGTTVELADIEQVFIPLETMKSRHFLSLTDDIPAAFFEATHDIIVMAQKAYASKLNSVLLFTLSEHLYYAVERSRSGTNIVNKLSWEVKRYYKKEYEIGVMARDIIAARFNTELPEDEAVHIAFHLINASSENQGGDAHAQVQIVNRVCEIVRYKFKKSIDTDTINYNRFITHLRYFAERVTSNNIVYDENNDFYEELLKFHPSAMSVAWAIRDYISEKYALALSKSELTWLSIHISRLAAES
ncbi:PRD domain-containing protein [Cedecea colo]|uniref:PRD domain-containing protein n=1 Tax=Cedecea colo TaxID=2552946 RepID=A0ABX0VRQ5_9ENTR|nr:PRD domain-containing protein [Cedecea colo]